MGSQPFCWQQNQVQVRRWVFILKGLEPGMPLPAVVQVCHRRPRHVGKTTILGAAAGAALGYILVAQSWNDGTSATQGAKALGTTVPVGAAVGTVVGFFLGIGRGAWEPVYEKQINH